MIRIQRVSTLQVHHHSTLGTADDLEKQGTEAALTIREEIQKIELRPHSNYSPTPLFLAPSSLACSYRRRSSP